ncbi:MAG: hypothetical protein LBE24_04205 [Methylobacillus sp.]|jgi:hypothetical protein|nr:hypothetical protein [Methylobacillus sp.]
MIEVLYFVLTSDHTWLSVTATQYELVEPDCRMAVVQEEDFLNLNHYTNNLVEENAELKNLIKDVLAAKTVELEHVLGQAWFDRAEELLEGEKA